MKVSDLEAGTKILVPCSRCGYKRSLIFQNKSMLRKQQHGHCHRCAAEIKELIPVNHCRARRMVIDGTPLHENME